MKKIDMILEFTVRWADISQIYKNMFTTCYKNNTKEQKSKPSEENKKDLT